MQNRTPLQLCIIISATSRKLSRTPGGFANHIFESPVPNGRKW